MRSIIKVVINNRGLVCVIFILSSYHAKLHTMEGNLSDSSLIIEDHSHGRRIIENEDEQSNNEENPNTHSRVYLFFDKYTGFVDNVLSKRLADLPGLHCAYAKYPLSTKFALVGLGTYIVLSNSIIKGFLSKLKNCITQAMGIANEDDDDDDDETGPYKPHKLSYEKRNNEIMNN
jgi:hypothetical protein